MTTIARHRIDVRGNPIPRQPLFPIVRFVLIGVLMFAGWSVALDAWHVEPEPLVPAAVSVPECGPVDVPAGEVRR